MSYLSSTPEIDQKQPDENLDEESPVVEPVLEHDEVKCTCEHVAVHDDAPLVVFEDQESDSDTPPPPPRPEFTEEPTKSEDPVGEIEIQWNKQRSTADVAIEMENSIVIPHLRDNFGEIYHNLTWWNRISTWSSALSDFSLLSVTILAFLASSYPEYSSLPIIVGLIGITALALKSFANSFRAKYKTAITKIQSVAERLGINSDFLPNVQRDVMDNVSYESDSKKSD